MSVMRHVAASLGACIAGEWVKVALLWGIIKVDAEVGVNVWCVFRQWLCI